MVSRSPPADMLLALLGMESRYVDGPSEHGRTTCTATEIPRTAFEQAKADAVSFIRATGRLPAEVWVGSQTLALADFAATLAGDDGASASVSLRKGNPEMEKYIATDPARSIQLGHSSGGFSSRASAGPGAATGLDIEARRAPVNRGKVGASFTRRTHRPRRPLHRSSRR